MIQIKRFNSNTCDFYSNLEKLLSFENVQDNAVDSIVTSILTDIRERKDTALIEYTNRLDNLSATSSQDLELTHTHLQQSLSALSSDQRNALEQAEKRIRSYHEKQSLVSWHYTDLDDTLIGQKITPLDRVGLYVPGGRASYPSSVMMNAIPAKIAGVKELIMVVPTPNGEKNDIVLAAAAISEVNRVFTIGGAQAIGALAYGTETIPQVDKIVGPGNAYVAAAKRQVFGIVGIDMIAGPSEILIICDGKTNPDWIAMDLFSQAEHDELAQAILLSPDAQFLEQVMHSINCLIPKMSRKNIIRAALEKRGALIQVQDLEEACAIANRIAPEHLELSVDQPEYWVNRICHAGAIFLGRYTCEALGDYCAGPNHVLPTSRTARFSSPLGVYDFQKRSSLIRASPRGAAEMGRIASVLAYEEGLQAHALSAEYRYKD